MRKTPCSVTRNITTAKLKNILTYNFGGKEKIVHPIQHLSTLPAIGFLLNKTKCFFS